MSRHRPIVSLFALALVGPGLFAAPALAQSASEIASAKQWFTEGLALEEKAQFVEALERFRRALGVKATPQILFHVGLCESKTGALVEGLSDLERAVELAKSESNQQVVSAGTSEIETLRPRVPTVELTLGSERPSQVSLDDKPLAESALASPISVNPGAHVLMATFATGEFKRRIELVEGDHAKIELVPPKQSIAEKPATPPGTPPSDHPLPPRDDAKSSKSNVLPWVLIGGGVVATLGGFYLWKLRGDQIGKLDDICPERDVCPVDRESEVDDLESKGKTYTALGIGAWAIGGVALATGGYLLLGSSSSETAVRVSPALGPRTAGAFVGGHF